MKLLVTFYSNLTKAEICQTEFNRKILLSVRFTSVYNRKFDGFLQNLRYLSFAKQQFCVQIDASKRFYRVVVFKQSFYLLNKSLVKGFLFITNTQSKTETTWKEFRFSARPRQSPAGHNNENKIDPYVIFLVSQLRKCDWSICARIWLLARTTIF